MTSPKLQVVLIEPEIHWNTGNIGRTCLATGTALHLVKPLGFSMEAKQLRRAGLDYWPEVSVKVWSNWSTLETKLAMWDPPYFISPEAERTIWDASFKSNSVLVFGKETEGLPSTIRQRYQERLVSIPMHYGTVRSLNLSTSVGIVLYEALRQLQSFSNNRPRMSQTKI